jgi:hypothetical protein
MGVIHKIIEGEQVGTLFMQNKNEDFYLIDFIEENL